MEASELLARLRGGQRVYGTFVQSNSPHLLALMGRVPLDFVIIDTEHTPLDRLTVAWMCRGYGAMGLPAIVRIPSPDPYEAAMTLDGGAAGIIAPYVEAPSQVRQLVGAVKLKPLKGKRLSHALENPDCLESSLREYLEKANQGNILVVNIESVPALENLDAILRVEGLDAVLVGPHDLSCSLGIPEQYDNPRFVSAVDAIIERTRARGLGAGIHVTNPALARNEPHWAKSGANLIVHYTDLLAASEKLREDFRNLREALGQTTGHAAEDQPGK